MAWDDEPPNANEMGASPDWDAAPPTAKELGGSKAPAMNNLDDVKNYIQANDGHGQSFKNLVSGAVGVAEAMNPLDLPRLLSEHFHSAANKAGLPDTGQLQFPKLGVSEIAAGTRTAAQLPFSDQSASDLYSQELDRQDNFNKNFINPDVKSGAETATGVLNLASGLKSMVKSPWAQETYAKMAPYAPKILAKVRGISPETISLYANPETRSLIDSIAESSSDLHKGQIENASRVAGDLENARSGFIKGTQDIIDAELERAGQAGTPIDISPITDKLKSGKAELLPVGQTHKSSISKLDSMISDIEDLAGSNTAPEQTDYIRRVAGGAEIPQFSQFTKNATQPVNETAKYISPEMTQAEQMTRASGLGAGAEAPLTARYPLSDNLVPTTEMGAKPYLTPKQLNRLRRTLNLESEAAFETDAGKTLPGKEQVAGAGDTVRDLLDQLSPNITNENQKLTRLFVLEKAMKRAGLNKNEIDPSKLVNLLTAGPKMAAAETPHIAELDQLLGTNLGQERSLARASSELNPEGVFGKFLTGAQTTPLAAGGILKFLGLPVIGPALGTAYAAVQAPITTKPLIKGGVMADKVMRSILNGTETLGPYASKLKNAAMRGQQAFAISHFVLSQTDPEYRKKLDEINSQ